MFCLLYNILRTRRHRSLFSNFSFCSQYIEQNVSKSVGSVYRIEFLRFFFNFIAVLLWISHFIYVTYTLLQYLKRLYAYLLNKHSCLFSKVRMLFTVASIIIWSMSSVCQRSMCNNMHSGLPYIDFNYY